MFGGRFGLIRFGLNTIASAEIRIATSFSESLKCLSGFGSDSVIENVFSDTFKGEYRATIGLPVIFSAKDSLQCIATPIMGVILSFSGKEELKNVSFIGKDISINLCLTDALSNLIWVSKDIYFKENFLDALKNSSYLAKNIICKAELSDVLSSIVSSVVLEKETLIIQVTIPPGGSLQIDSETYSVLLNGSNILHLHDGGWVWYDRDIVGISIDSGSGGQLEGTAIYTERYL